MQFDDEFGAGIEHVVDKGVVDDRVCVAVGNPSLHRSEHFRCLDLAQLTAHIGRLVAGENADLGHAELIVFNTLDIALDLQPGIADGEIGDGQQLRRCPQHQRMVAGHVARRRRAEPEVLVGGIDVHTAAVDRHRHDHVVELVDVGQLGQDALIDVDERELRRHAHGFQHRNQQDGVVLAVTVAIAQCLARRFRYVGAAPEFDGFVVQLFLYVVTDDVDLALRVVDTHDEACRHVRHTICIQLFIDDCEVITARLAPARARRADRYPRKHSIVPGLHRLPAVDDGIRRFPDERSVTDDRRVYTERPESKFVVGSRDEYRAVADRAAAGQIVDFQGELVLLDVDTLGHDHLDHHTRRQARHRQVSGLFRARLVAVDSTGDVIGAGVSLRDFLA